MDTKERVQSVGGIVIDAGGLEEILRDIERGMKVMKAGHEKYFPGRPKTIEYTALVAAMMVGLGMQEDADENKGMDIIMRMLGGICVILLLREKGQSVGAFSEVDLEELPVEGAVALQEALTRGLTLWGYTITYYDGAIEATRPEHQGEP